MLDVTLSSLEISASVILLGLLSLSHHESGDIVFRCRTAATQDLVKMSDDVMPAITIYLNLLRNSGTAVFENNKFKKLELSNNFLH